MNLKMMKIIARNRTLLGHDHLIRAGFCTTKPDIPSEMKKLTKLSLPSTKLPAIELWEPGRGPVERGLPTKKEIRNFTKGLKKEFSVWTEEIKEGWKFDPVMFADHGKGHLKYGEKYFELITYLYAGFF